MRGDFAEATRLERLRPEQHDPQTLFWRWEAFDAALTLAAKGDVDGARARLGTWPAELKSRRDLDPENEDTWACVAGMEMLLGHPEEALRSARKAVELLPESRDAADGPFYSRMLALVQAWTGDKDNALAALARLLRTPGSFDFGGSTNIHGLKNGPWFYPLHGDPRFEALMNDPANNAPLF
jgi:tetratricopeptide (TPR) repeat protein